MIKILGVQRIVILLLLLAVNGALGYAAYMMFIPQKDLKERQLSGVRGEVSTLRADIDGLQVEFAQLDSQREEFEALKKDGFFDGQSRRKAELIFNQIQERSGVVSAVASIAAGTIEENEQALKADHQLLKSEVAVRIEAVNDLDVFRYIYLVNEFFPGHVSIKDIKLEREADVSGVILRGIASGKNPNLVSADLSLIWRTMIPKEAATNNEGGI